MKKSMGVDVLLSWLVIAGLTVGCLSGCSGSKPSLDTTSEVGEDWVEELPSAKEHNEDDTSNLGAWGRGMGSVLISINDGNPYYFGGYENTEANAQAAADILKTSWNIANRKQLLKQIQQLLQTGSRKEYLREAKEMNALSSRELKRIMKQLSGALQIHYKEVRYNWKLWGRRGLLAWDMCRISHLVQWGYIAGYLNVEEAQAMIEPAAKKLQKNFDSWQEVITNWLDGYALSAVIDRSAGENDYDNRMKVYQELVEAQEQSDLLYDDALFSEEIIPLQGVSCQSIMQELRSTKNTENKKSKGSGKEKPQGADSEDTIE